MINTRKLTYDKKDVLLKFSNQHVHSSRGLSHFESIVTKFGIAIMKLSHSTMRSNYYNMNW